MARISCLLVLCIAVSYSQVQKNNLSLEDAVKRASENSIVIGQYEAQLNKVKSRVTKAEEIPNPTFSYSTERLENNLVQTEETIFSIEMPISFLWTRWSDITSEELRSEAKSELLNHIKQQLIRDVKISYMNILYFNARINSYLAAEKELARLLISSENRYKQGDLSGYELQRIKIEIQSHGNERVELESQRELVFQRLLRLIDQQNNPSITLTSEFPKSIDLENIEVYLNKAQKNRSNLKAAHLLFEQHKESVSNKKMKRIPDASIIFSRKDQGNDLTGSMIQLNIQLPLFNLNSGDVEMAESSQNEQAFVIRQLKQKIKTEVTQSYHNLHRYSSILKNREKNTVEVNLLKTAVLRYEKGEASLVELLDGIRSYLNSKQTFYKLKRNFSNYLYQFENSIQDKVNQ